MTDQAMRVRALNDNLRTNGIGGTLVMTRGIAALPCETVQAIMTAVQGFAAFGPDNDPYGEHDFGLLRVGGHRVMFKIDYYDASMSGLSPDPADPRVTRRVLTILLSEEY